MGKYNIDKRPDYNKPEMAWAFGFTAADGGLYNSKRKKDPPVIQYCVNAKDADVLFKIKDIFKLEHPINEHYNNQHKHTASLRFTDSRYQLELFGEDNLDVKNRFPQAFIDKNTRHYLRGLFDGDGCLHHRKRGGFMMIFINEKEEITKNFAYCVSKYLGIGFKVPKLVEKDHIWRIQYESRSARLLAWWLYHDDIDHMSLQRKRETFQNMVNPLSNDLDQFFESFFGKEIRYVPKKHGDGLIIPISMGKSTDSLAVCKGIQNICDAYNIKCTPVCLNKGKVKYYVPYFPKEYVSSIKMLRPFEYLIKG